MPAGNIFWPKQETLDFVNDYDSYGYYDPVFDVSSRDRANSVSRILCVNPVKEELSFDKTCSEATSDRPIARGAPVHLRRLLPRQRVDCQSLAQEILSRHLRNPTMAPEQDMRGHNPPAGGRVGRGAQRPTGKEQVAAVKPPPSAETVQKALAWIKAIFGSWFYAEVKARNLIQKTEEIVRFAKLTDA
jgi:hypothetical protein